MIQDFWESQAYLRFPWARLCGWLTLPQLLQLQPVGRQFYECLRGSRGFQEKCALLRLMEGSPLMAQPQLRLIEQHARHVFLRQGLIQGTLQIRPQPLLGLREDPPEILGDTFGHAQWRSFPTDFPVFYTNLSHVSSNGPRKGQNIVLVGASNPVFVATSESFVAFALPNQDFLRYAKLEPLASVQRLSFPQCSVVFGVLVNVNQLYVCLRSRDPTGPCTGDLIRVFNLSHGRLTATYELNGSLLRMYVPKSLPSTMIFLFEDRAYLEFRDLPSFQRLVITHEALIGSVQKIIFLNRGMVMVDSGGQVFWTLFETKIVNYLSLPADDFVNIYNAVSDLDRNVAFLTLHFTHTQENLLYFYRFQDVPDLLFSMLVSNGLAADIWAHHLGMVIRHVDNQVRLYEYPAHAEEMPTLQYTRSISLNLFMGVQSPLDLKYLDVIPGPDYGLNLLYVNKRSVNVWQTSSAEPVPMIEKIPLPAIPPSSARNLPQHHRPRRRRPNRR